MKAFFFSLLLLFFIGGCSKASKPSLTMHADFESLMGKMLPEWKHVQTREDFENLAFFKSVYEKNLPELSKAHTRSKIPRVIHFIWLGPKPFPRESIENVRSWIGLHPNWTVKFWTDRKRPLPHPCMQECLVEKFSFEQLGSFFHCSDNFAEKSDLLRYEILYQQGGVYVDHDVKCLHSFESLNNAYDFYCGMEVPFATALSSCVLPTNNIVGSKQNHLILKHMMSWLVERWEQVEADYPGADRDAVINRISHRTFLVLGENFKKYANAEKNIDIALPSYFFNAPLEKDALFAQHQYAGTWFENEPAFEKNVRKRLMMMSKKINKLLLGCGVLCGLNVLGFGAVLMAVYRKKIK